MHCTVTANTLAQQHTDTTTHSTHTHNTQHTHTHTHTHTAHTHTHTAHTAHTHTHTTHTPHNTNTAHPKTKPWGSKPGLGLLSRDPVLALNKRNPIGERHEQTPRD